MHHMTEKKLERLYAAAATADGEMAAKIAAEIEAIEVKHGIAVVKKATAPAPAPAPAPEAAPAPAPAPEAAPAAPAAPVAPAEITVELKSSEKRCVNYTFARIKRDAAVEIAKKIGMEKAKELFAKTKGVEYNQRTGDYSYYFDGTSARQYGDILTIKFKNPNELEIEFAEYIKSNPSSVNGFNPKK